MKKFWLVFSAVALLASLAAPSFADVLRGRIKSVDADKKVVTLVEGHKDYTFIVGDQSKILNVKGDPLKGGLKSADLKADRRVTVNYSTKDGASILESLQLRP